MRPALIMIAAVFAACQSTHQSSAQAPTWSETVSLPDVELSTAPFDVVHVNWKERRQEPYVYLEHVGDYRTAGARISELFKEVARQGAPITGPPFILFYDDPAVTPVTELRARICVAIDDSFSAMSPLYLDDLPRTMVVYAAVGGPFPDVPRAYPGMFEYMAARGWAARPPIREIYLVSPADHPAAELITEAQIPWVPGG